MHSPPCRTHLHSPGATIPDVPLSLHDQVLATLLSSVLPLTSLILRCLCIFLSTVFLSVLLPQIYQELCPLLSIQFPCFLVLTLHFQLCSSHSTSSSLTINLHYLYLCTLLSTTALFPSSQLTSTGRVLFPLYCPPLCFPSLKINLHYQNQYTLLSITAPSPQPTLSRLPSFSQLFHLGVSPVYLSLASHDLCPHLTSRPFPSVFSAPWTRPSTIMNRTFQLPLFPYLLISPRTMSRLRLQKEVIYCHFWLYSSFLYTSLTITFLSFPCNQGGQ